MTSFKIAPSILSADYANFESELKKLEATGAEYAHIDMGLLPVCVLTAS